MGKALLGSLIVIVASLLCPAAQACSCVARAECGAFQIRDTLFVGRALSVQIVHRNEGNFPIRRRIFRFEVSEPLAQSPHKSEVVEIETGMGGGDCGYGFQIGESYLIDASHYGPDGQLSTGICSATRPEASANDLVREIRAILAHQKLPDLSGTVIQQGSLYGASSTAHPLPGMPVHLTPANGNAYTAITDAQGIYTFHDLPATEYRIVVDLPPNLVSYDAAMQSRKTIEIPVSGGAACHRDIRALPSGSISGQILDRAGKPMGMYGAAWLTKRGPTPHQAISSGQSADGRFTLQFVPEGEYRLVFRNFAPLHEAWMQPSAAHPQGTVTLRAGEHIDGIQISLQ